MRIVRLQSENFKRLKAVDITPTDGVVELRGENGEGKSSVLDSIYAALGGANAAPIKPVRTGESHAIIKLDLGDVKVTRYFDDKGDLLKVENADGARYSDPQKMLNALVGSISFDPLQFARMKRDEQAAELRRLVPLRIDINKLAEGDKADKLARRDINRDGAALVARRDAIIVPADLPAEKPDKDGLVAQLAAAAETNGAIDREARRRSDRGDAKATAEGWAIKCREEAENYRKLAEEGEEKALALDKAAEEIAAELAGLDALATPVDVADLQSKIADAERVERLFAAKEGHALLDAQVVDLRAKADAYTAKVTKRARLRGLVLAKAKMPVEGLSLARLCDVAPTETGEELIVTYQGEPFDQASGAQQLRVSMQLAMAANPRLRVMLIKDGSLLDKNGMALVRELAADGDYQVWLEAVGEGDGVGIIMEAGKVRGAPEPEAIEPPVKRRTKSEGDGEPATAVIADGQGEGALSPSAPSPVTKSGSGSGVDSTPNSAGVVGQDAGAGPPAPASDRPRRPQAMREFTTQAPKPVGGLFDG